METRNDKISLFQFMVILSLVCNSLFVGYGIIIVFDTSIRDTWIIPILGLVIGIIPILMFIYIMNYRPDKNIFDKNKYLFGNIIGTILNTIITLFILLTVTFVIWSLCSFTITMYLSKTPEFVIALMFISVAIYAIYKGIETIARTSEMLFYLVILVVIFSVIFLFPSLNLKEMKPFFENGYKPIVYTTLLYLSYFFAPIILMTVIPKDDIVENQKFSKYVFIGYSISSLIMILIFFVIPMIMTPMLARIYRFPAYYVLRKISIGGAINNLENFLSLHWIINQFALIVMGLYFIKEYFKNMFKVKQEKTNIIFISIIGLIIIFLIQNPILPSVIIFLNFMKQIFPLLFGGIIFIFIISCIMIRVKKNNNQYKNEYKKI